MKRLIQNTSVFFLFFTTGIAHAQQSTASPSATPVVTTTPATTVAVSPTSTPLPHSPTVRPSPTGTSIPTATLTPGATSPSTTQNQNITAIPTPTTPLPTPTPTNMVIQAIQEELPSIISFLRPPRGMVLHQNITDNYYPETTLPLNRSVAMLTAGFVCIIQGLFLLTHL